MTDRAIEKILYAALMHRTEFYHIRPLKGGWVRIDTLVERINFTHSEDIVSAFKVKTIAMSSSLFSINFFQTKIRANATQNKQKPMHLHRAIPPSLLYVYWNKDITVDNEKNIIPTHKQKYIAFQSQKNDDSKHAVLQVNCEQMSLSGYAFFKSETGNWYTKKIPTRFILASTPAKIKDTGGKS